MLTLDFFSGSALTFPPEFLLRFISPLLDFAKFIVQEVDHGTEQI
jgi:hypothetical protein